MQLGLVAALAALVLAAPAHAATGDGAKVAKALKPVMQRFYRSKGSDDVFTKVTCVIAAKGRVAHCVAHFTSASLHETGWFDVVATGGANGIAHWRATGVTCRDARSGKTIAC